MAASPSLFWSVPNQEKYPPWRKASADESPGGEELTLAGDAWRVRRGATVETLPPSELGRRIAQDLVKALA